MRPLGRIMETKTQAGCHRAFLRSRTVQGRLLLGDYLKQGGSDGWTDAGPGLAGLGRVGGVSVLVCGLGRMEAR